MALSLKEFVTQLDESGVLSAVDIATFQKSQYPPAESAEDLGKQLVKHKKVTRLQAQLVYQGKGKQLLLGNYLILEKIGAGGMGDVYLAEHRRMKRQVALKTLPAAMTKDVQSIQRFQREVQAAAKLTHPNIVAAYDADEAKGVHYFVMEYVEGIDLSAVVKKQGVLKVDVAVDYILQAAKGLEFAHNKGVIHRDIKPANMLVDNEGTIKILDMGLARIEDEAHEVTGTQLTQDGTVMGTVDYMSPEQAKDTHAADARSDIYSLGCSLYYLLTGESVYSGSTMVNRIMAHQNDPIPSLTGKHILISHDVDAVFQKMVAKKPEDRFQSMSEVIGAIQACGVLNSDSSSPTISSEPSDVALAEFLRNQEMASAPTVSISESNASQKETLTTGFLDKTFISKVYQPQKQLKSGKAGRNKVLIATGVVLACVLLLSGIFITVDTSEGTIVLEIDQPELAGAVVSVDDQKKITIKTGEGQEPITVKADKKTHILKVTKGGFETFTKQFTVKAGGKEAIKVRLVPSYLDSNNELNMFGDIDREVAEWVIGMGGMIRIGDKDFTNVKQLPTLPFLISYVKLTGTSVKDDDLKRLAGLNNLTSLDLSKTLVSDTGLQYLKDIPLLVINITSSTQITDEGLGYLTNMPSLIQLHASSTTISNSGVERLKDMKQLEDLSLGNTQIDDLSLGYLSGLKNLKALAVFSTAITDSGLKQLKEMQQLKRITLGNTRITNAGLKELADLKNLEKLYFTKCKISDSGLAYLKDLKNLKELVLDSTSITDAGLQHLHGLKKLESLDLQKTKVTPQGIAELQKALPKCKVVSDFRTKPRNTENYALKFDGSGKVLVSSLKIKSPAEFTIEAIVKPESAQHGMIVCNAGRSGFAFKVLGSRWIFDGFGEVQKFSVSSDELVAFNEWSHVAAVISEKQAKLFVNGQLQKKIARLDKLKPSNLPIVIGANPEADGFRDYLQGSIRAVRISGSALYSKSFNPPQSFVHDKKTMALYHFDEVKGDVLKDSSGNGHDGKIVGAKWVKVDDELQVIEEQPKENYALEFDGKTSYVDVPSLKYDGTRPVTLEALIRPNFPKNGGRVSTVVNLGTVPFQLISMSNSEYKAVLVAVVDSNKKNYRRIHSLNTRPVTHLAATYDGSTLHLYVDGVLIRRSLEKETPDGAFITTNDKITLKKLYPNALFHIGKISNSLKNQRFFDGIIDEVRVSNTVRYTKDFTPTKRFGTDKHTMALYHFDEGKGDVLKDSSGNGRDGKIVGAKWVKVDDELQVIEPATTGDSSMTDREVAEWVLGLGGDVQIDDKIIAEIKKLPTAPFVFDNVTLKGTSVRDDDLKRLAGLKILNRLNLEQTLVSDTGLQYLKNIPLHALSLANTQITDKGLDYLSNMSSLLLLHVGSTAVSNSGVERLKDMKQLESILLADTQIDDIGLGYLAGLTNLESLVVHMTPITDTGLKHLKKMQQLKKLKLGSTRITNAGLKELAGLTNLESLDFRNCKISDSGLAYLKDLKSLEDLGLDSTSITDVGLLHLHGLKKLESLDLRNTKVTPQGIAGLQKALPNCKIASDLSSRKE